MSSKKDSSKDAKLSSVYRQAKPGAPVGPATPAKTTRASGKRKAQELENATPAPEVLARSQGEGAVSRADLSQDEQKLRKFDLTTKFGPCAGISRLERWERAAKFGLGPPEEVRAIILAAGGAGSAADKGLWHERV
ncbi:hypothetical protein CHLRE_06g292950v5 [Chlamydomonas reinhardtii]|uniref:DNA polymerase delta subunit 4 n=1 Tax=Chlamydomonas reinhardtii TaxID=3055 RepID=A0A2K3DQE9_CHLRE|nr:uncharacterized protein CHLRE_06g292950v5 [Chlamydomonas reinhardtii]PNW82761.1 hypothetical protein CHLRE_06g292950v5 [Chlamydomonas reinhardtii]